MSKLHVKMNINNDMSVVAVYADTRIVPFIWVPSSLETMKERFDLQKKNEGYKVRSSCC